MSVPGTSVVIADPRSGTYRMAERAYSMEDPSFPLDDPSVWNEGVVSTAGQRVSPVSALHLPAFYQGVTRIASDVARCPLELYRERDGAFEALKSDPLYRLTAIEPNREMDAFKFWCRVMVQRLVWQNAYIYIAKDVTGRPVELLPLLSDRTRPARRDGLLYYVTETNGREIPIPASQVLHVEGVGLDNLAAIELCRLMRDAFGLAMSQIEFSSKVMRSGGRRGGVLQIPLGMPKVAADRMEEGFRKKYEDSGSWFSTVILRDNATFHEAQMTLRDSQSIEAREESVRDVARALNIRPGHLGVESSGVYGNKSDDTRDYLDMTLRPHMTGIASQCRIKLLAPARQANDSFEHNTDDLLQMSVKEQFEAYGVGVEKTIITSNEARGKLGFKPHEEGDALRNPNTQTARQEGGKQKGATGQTPSKKPTRTTETDEGEALNAAHRRLAAATIRSVVAVIGGKAERAAASGAKFINWLDEKLPFEADTLQSALAPVGECIGIRDPSWRPHGGFARCAARHVYDELSRNLQGIADTTSEAALRSAVQDFFHQWEPPTWPHSELLTSD